MVSKMQRNEIKIDGLLPNLEAAVFEAAKNSSCQCGN